MDSKVPAEAIWWDSHDAYFLRLDKVDLLITAEREACKRDVCMYCSGNAPGYEPATGPNQSGNYTHESVNKAHLVAQGIRGVVLCAASGIFVRERYAAAAEGEK